MSAATTTGAPTSASSAPPFLHNNGAGSRATLATTAISSASSPGVGGMEGGMLMLTTWQDSIRRSWEERDRRERAYDEIILQYQKLAKHAAMLKERNTSLLNASTSNAASTPASANSSSHARSASSAGGPSAAAASSTNPNVTADPTPPANPVQEAYVKSLETQLSGMRDELATLYKTQSHNAQRLLLLNEQLRDKEGHSQTSSLELHTLREQREKLQRTATDLKESLGEKDKTIMLLQDELNTLSLELNQIEARNDELKRDNAGLLQRWLDKMNEEAERMNEANVYVREVEDRKRAGAAGSPDKDKDKDEAVEATTKGMEGGASLKQ